MRYGIFTGGGDVPGLNSTIKAAVYRAADEGHEVVGLRRGWAGLLHLNPADPQTQEQLVVPLNRANTRTIDRSGGTFLHTSRTHPGRVSRQGPARFPQGRLHRSPAPRASSTARPTS